MIPIAIRGKVARSIKWLAATVLFAVVAALNAAPLDARNFTSLGNLAITSGTLTFDTDALTVTGGGAGLTSTTGVLHAQPGVGSPEVAVFAFGDVSVGADAVVVVTGSRPAAILSRNDVAIAANLQFNGAVGTPGDAGTAGPNGAPGGGGNSSGSSGGLGGIAPAAAEKGGNGGRGGYDQQNGERGQDGSGGAPGGPGGTFSDSPFSPSQGGISGGDGTAGTSGTPGFAGGPTTFASLLLRNGAAGGAGTPGTNGKGGGGGGGAGGVNGVTGIIEDKRGAGGGSGGAGGTGGDLGGGGKGAQTVEIGAVNSVVLSNSFQARGGSGGSGGTGGGAGGGASGGPPSSNWGPGGNGGNGGRGGDGGPGAGGSGGIIYVHGKEIVPPQVLNVLGGAGGTNSTGGVGAAGAPGSARLEGNLVLAVTSAVNHAFIDVHGSAAYAGKVILQVANDGLADDFASQFTIGQFFRMSGAPVTNNALFEDTTFEVRSPNRAYRATLSGAAFTLAPILTGSEVLAMTGEPVPGAGAGDIPAGATWVSFGAPTVNDAGTVAFAGKWKSTEGTGGGIFTDNALRVKVGALVPGGGIGTLPEDAFFKKLGDPVIDGDGALTFFATLAGTKLPASQATAVCSVSAAGSVSIVTRTGNDAPGTGGATFKKFYSISRDGGAVLIHAAISGGSATPPVTAANDTGVWKWAGGVGTLLLREGDSIGQDKQVKSFAMFANSGVTRGQGRWHVSGDGAGEWLCAARVTFTDGTHALVTGSHSDPLSNTAVAATGMEATSLGASGLPGAKWAKFGLPAISADGLNLGTLATLEIGAGDVTAANDTAIFSGSVLEARLREGDLLPGVTDAKFVSFQDPVFASGSEFAVVAVSKSTAPGAKPSTGIWSSVGSPLQLLARIGGSVDATAGSPTWKSFSSLVVPAGDRGPLFVAKVKGKAPTVTAKNDQGVWGVNSAGELVQVFREGEVLNGKSVLTFTALGAVDGAKEVGRSWNNEGEIVWRASFKGKQQAVVVTRIP